MIQKLKWMLVVLGLYTSSMVLLATETPSGILIIKPDSGTSSPQPRVVEYASITEHLIPATDYITVKKPNGDRDVILKTNVIQRVEYPRDVYWNIFSESMIGSIAERVSGMRELVKKYPATEVYLSARMAAMQKEVDLFNQGQRKLNGSWISSEDFNKLLEMVRERKAALAAARRKAEADAAAAIQQREEQIASESKRLADAEAAAEAKQRAEEQAIINKKKQAAELAKKKKQADALARKPKPKQKLNIPWGTLFLMLAGGAGIYYGVKYYKAHSGIRSISGLDWQKFELLVAEIYRRQGYMVEISAGFGAEQGVDITLTRRMEIILVQTKHWKTLKAYKISEPEIHVLCEAVEGVVDATGVYVTSGEYTKEARNYVVDRPISLLGVPDMELLLPQVMRRNEDIFNISLWINEFIAASKIVDPVCPKCKRAMELKKARDGSPVWKCQDTQGCAGRLDARVDLVRNRQR